MNTASARFSVESNGPQPGAVLSLGDICRQFCLRDGGVVLLTSGTGEPGGLPSMGSQRVGHN